MISIILLTDIYPDEYPNVFWHIAIDGGVKPEDIDTVQTLTKAYTNYKSVGDEEDIWTFARQQFVILGYTLADSMVYDLKCFTEEPEEHDIRGVD